MEMTIMIIVLIIVMMLVVGVERNTVLGSR